MAKKSNSGRQLTPWQVTTFFFSHFPNSYGERDMWKIFQRWGRVVEVFISRKLNRWGNRFGFVRFSDVKNVSKLEFGLVAIRIGSMKLYANLPRYWKNDAFLHSKNTSLKPRIKQQNIQGKVVKQWRAKTGYQ